MLKLRIDKQAAVIDDEILTQRMLEDVLRQTAVTQNQLPNWCIGDAAGAR